MTAAVSQTQSLDSPADTAVVGGGIMGCVVAHRLARAGQRVVLVDRQGLCMAASGVNAGTLSVQIKREELIPYALRGLDLWRTAGDWLGDDLGFREVGGLALAFTDDEAETLTTRMTARADRGAPIEIVGPNRARELEPGLSAAPVLASFCPVDGYAGSYLLGRAMRRALAAAGVRVHEHCAVDRIVPGGSGTDIVTDRGTLRAARVAICGGAWTEALLSQAYGVDIPVTCRVNQVAVTERMPQTVRRVIGAATGLLTLKQAANGTVLIGGGWQGRGDPETGAHDILPENLVGNLRLAAHAVPALRGARVVRAWAGLEGSAPDGLPLAGPVPGRDDAYVLACVRGGFTIGPYIAQLLADRILGRAPEMPLFDPARLVAPDGA
ncbi:FAD-binding oxidoreductase [Rhodobacteraceae bacterium CCMM004]|nr:FAD-binding oxidoreductase [Rhodobacteraceae bacterium CCMM004]